MAKSTVASEGKNIAKNMIITVLTTVLGATAVYFLGFSNKKSSLSKLEKEEVTVQAWKTYVTLENIYTKNSTSLFRDAVQYGGFKEVIVENRKESEKFMQSVNELMLTDGLDKDMVTMLKRRLENETKQIPIGEKLYVQIDELIDVAVDKKWNNSQLNDSVVAMSNRYTEKNKGMVERSLNDIEELSKTLTERYDQPFDMNEFLIIQVYRNKRDMMSILDDEKTEDGGKKVTTGGVKAEGTEGNDASIDKEYFEGKWDAQGATITFSADGNLSWSVKSPPSEATGTWEVVDQKLVMNITKHPQTGKKGKWMFTIGQKKAASFQMILTVEPFNYYVLTRL